MAKTHVLRHPGSITGEKPWTCVIPVTLGTWRPLSNSCAAPWHVGTQHSPDKCEQLALHVSLHTLSVYGAPIAHSKLALRAAVETAMAQHLAVVAPDCAGKPRPRHTSSHPDLPIGTKQTKATPALLLPDLAISPCASSPSRGSPPCSIRPRCRSRGAAGT